MNYRYDDAVEALLLLPPHAITTDETVDAQQERGERRRTSVPEMSVAEERRMAILKALEILTSVSKGLYVPAKSRGGSGRPLRLV